CRKFDREQRQKLRRPEQKEQDRQQQLAQARSQLNDLARREREWSQQCQNCKDSNSGGSKSSSPSPGQPNETNAPKRDKQDAASQEKEGPSADQGSSEAPSRAEIAEAQRKMREELAALRAEIDKLAAAGKAAGNQAEEADRSMQRGLDEFLRENDAAASREGTRSARQLEQLADHLASMNARDFGRRLDQAGKLARQLADRQARVDENLKGAGDKERLGATSRRDEGKAVDSRSGDDAVSIGYEEPVGHEEREL